MAGLNFRAKREALTRFVLLCLLIILFTDKQGSMSGKRVGW